MSDVVTSVQTEPLANTMPRGEAHRIANARAAQTLLEEVERLRLSPVERNDIAWVATHASNVDADWGPKLAARLRAMLERTK